MEFPQHLNKNPEQSQSENVQASAEWLTLIGADWQVTAARLRRCRARPPCTLAWKLAVFCSAFGSSNRSLMTGPGILIPISC